MEKVQNRIVHFTNVTMTKPTLVFLFLTALSCVVAVREDAVDDAKMRIIVREADAVADAVRNITIRTPQCKLQIASMANDYITNLNSAVYAINNVVWNVDTEESRKALAKVGLIISTYANDIQKCIANEPEQLKEKIALQLVETKEAVITFQQFKAPTEFSYNQLKRKHNIYVFAIYKLKYQALLFDKPNKELPVLINDGFADFEEGLKSLPLNGGITKVEIRHAMYHLSTILERNIYKLENWVEVNTNSTENIQKVQEVSNVFSELYAKLIRTAGEKHITLFLKLQFKHILETASQNAIKLASIEYYDNLGGQEFIRSCLFDFVAFGKAYGNNIKAVLQ